MGTRKQVLIITYYWPPSGGVGAHRWLKFAKYLPKFGWEPIVFTPEDPGHQLTDESLLNESKDIPTIKGRIWEPFKLLKGGRQGKQHGTILEKPERSIGDVFKIWIRGNIFIPDPRVFWVKPSVRRLEKILAEDQISHVITTGPPHSVHLIGLGLKRRRPIKWIADFRDPWSNWDIYDKMYMSWLARKRHRTLEKRIFDAADVILTVGKTYRENFITLGAKHVEVITNGYDPEDLPSNSDTAGDQFIIGHYGLLNELRDPENLWKALEEINVENADMANQIRIELGGVVSDSILTRIKRSDYLRSCVGFKGYLPHKRVFAEYKKSTILLVLMNNSDNARWILPAKLFEYMAAEKPVLMIGPADSDAAELIRNYKAGAVCEYNDKVKLKNLIRQFFDEFKKGRLKTNRTAIDKFNRINLTGELAELLNNL